MRCASRSPRWRRRAATSSCRRSASRATATSRPSCGTPRASSSSTAPAASRASIRSSAKETLNRWIAHETAKAAREITEAIEAYRFNEAAGAAYRFVWNVYCDWYVELSKPLLTGPDGAAKDETRAMAAWALDEILKLLHPFMPFITEELWRVTAETGPKRDALLVLAPWPTLDGLDDAKAEAEIGWLIDLVTAIRSVRAEMNVPPATPIPLVLAGASAETRARAGRWAEFVKRLARVADISFADAPPQGSVQLAGARRGRGAAAQGRDRPRRRARAAATRKCRRPRPTSRASTPSSAIPSSSPTPPRRWSKASARSARRREARRQKIVEALERLQSAQ